MSRLASHPRRDAIRLELRRNRVLSEMDAAAWDDLEPRLEIADYRKGDLLVDQGATDMEQVFVLQGILKRVAANAEGKEMILRFAAETDMDTFYAAWRLEKPAPYRIVAVTNTRVAKLPMPRWIEFLERHPRVRNRFELEVMKLISEVLTHTITLHLLDATGRLASFQRRQQDCLGRIPNKELASYLNLAPETYSRLKQRGASRP
jgi:CRP-like cAMP-binding protein